MAKKKPLVLTNGNIEQLQAGDYIGEVDFPSLNNGETSAIIKGMAVYLSGADTVKKAKADAAGTSRTIGLVVDANIAAAAGGNIQTEGVLAATTAEWDALTGQTGGLTIGASYFLSNATAGSITNAAPATGYSQEVGVAVSATELLINAKQVIKL